MTQQNATPLDSLLKIQKIKYVYSILPILMVVFSFVLSYGCKTCFFARYVSIGGLVLYFFVSLGLRLLSFCVQYVFRRYNKMILKLLLELQQIGMELKLLPL